MKNKFISVSRREVDGLGSGFLIYEATLNWFGLRVGTTGITERDALFGLQQMIRKASVELLSFADEIKEDLNVVDPDKNALIAAHIRREQRVLEEFGKEAVK